LQLDEFLSEYTDPRWPGTNSFIFKQVDGVCIFLKTELVSNQFHQSLCSIHKIKPICCREWSSSFEKAECQYGLKQKWGLSFDSSGIFQGPPEKLVIFKEYLKTL
jgi:Fe-S-cluster containining protein